MADKKRRDIKVLVNPRPRKLSVLANYEKSLISGFKYDCERFLEQFEKEQSFNYADFANIWQINNFTYIYADQTYISTFKVLMEVCFMTVKKYVMFPTSLYIKVGAFYLLYGLYYKQPVEGLVKVRLTLSEYKKLKQLMNEMLNRKQYDVLYIFAKMKSDNVFLYVAQPKPLNIELTKSVKSTTHLDDTFQTRETESSLTKFKDVLNDDTVLALTKTCSQYDALLEKYSEKCPNVAQFKSTVINDLQEAYENVFSQVSHDATEDAKKSNSKPIINKRQSIKLKALKNKNAEYRGSKRVLTAIDLDSEDDSDFD